MQVIYRNLSFIIALVLLVAGCNKAANPPPIGSAILPLENTRQAKVTAERTSSGGPQIANVDLGVAQDVAGKNDRLKIFTPWNWPAEGAPCIFTTPAGATDFSGTVIEDRRPQWYQFVQAGFVVVVYEIDGELKGETQRDAAAAFRDYEMSQAGLVNAKHAIDYALSRYSTQIDENRLYAVGHSSAGGRALFLAAHEPRIKGCVTFAASLGPSPDELDEMVLELTQVPDRFRASVESYSAERYANEIKCPVSMFHGTADTVVSHDRTESFAKTMDNASFESFEGFGHFDIVEQAMPHAIVWLRDLAGIESNLVPDGNIAATTVINRALLMERFSRMQNTIDSLAPALQPIARKMVSPSGLYTQQEAEAVVEPLQELARIPLNEADRDTVVELIFAWMGTNQKATDPGLLAMQTWCTKDHAQRIMERLDSTVNEASVCETLIALDARDEVLAMINYQSAGPIALAEVKRWGLSDEQIAQQCQEDAKSRKYQLAKTAKERLEKMGLSPPTGN